MPLSQVRNCASTLNVRGSIRPTRIMGANQGNSAPAPHRNNADLPEAACSADSPGVQRVVEICVCDGPAAFARRVHKTPLADINPDVIDLPALVAEEDQVAGQKLIRIYRLCCLALFCRGTRHIDPCETVRVVHEPAAIETFGIIAAVTIRRADIKLCGLRDKSAFLGRL
jgi:hypothetical protein